MHSYYKIYYSDANRTEDINVRVFDLTRGSNIPDDGESFASKWKYAQELLASKTISAAIAYKMTFNLVTGELVSEQVGHITRKLPQVLEINKREGQKTNMKKPAPANWAAAFAAQAPLYMQGAQPTILDDLTIGNAG